MGERMPGIKSHWGKNRKNDLSEIAVSILFLFLSKIVIIQDMDTNLVKCWHQIFLKAILGFGHQP